MCERPTPSLDPTGGGGGRVGTSRKLPARTGGSRRGLKVPFLAAGLPSLWSSREAFITLSTQSYKCSALAPLLPILLVAEGDPVRFLSVCGTAVVGGGGG